MTPLYTHCPHCGFPVVLNRIERLIPRFCRQCRSQYTPDAPVRRNGRANRRANGKGLTKATDRGRAALRAHIHLRRRSIR